MSRPYRHKRPSPGADLKWHDKAACKPEAILELGQVVDWEYQLSLFYSERDRGAERALRVMEAKRICWTLCVVREECLEFALRTRQVDGIWGGYEAVELMRMWRERVGGGATGTAPVDGQ